VAVGWACRPLLMYKHLASLSIFFAAVQAAASCWTVSQQTSCTMMPLPRRCTTAHFSGGLSFV
jgi:hypothetical protein